MRSLAVLIFAAVAMAVDVRGGEEKIRGKLEKTSKPEACAQITDALNELYYVAKSDAAEKMVANFIGKNQRVVVTGTVENKPNEQAPYITVTTVEAYTPKMPPAPPPPPPPPPAEKKDEIKAPDAKAPDAKPVEAKPDEKKPDEKKADEKKPEDKKPDEKKAEEKKVDERKGDEKK